MQLHSEPFTLTEHREFAAPLTIGVISDTHIYPHGRRRLPDEALDLFTRFGVGLILHGGDVNTAAVLRQLEDVAPVLAVLGNNDDAALQDALPLALTFSAGKYQFGLVHGYGGISARAEVRRWFAGRVDCAVYGHSHIPLIEEEDGTILFNPGSATDRRWQDHFGVGLIHVSETRIDPELVLYTDPRHLRNVKP